MCPDMILKNKVHQVIIIIIKCIIFSCVKYQFTGKDRRKVHYQCWLKVSVRLKNSLFPLWWWSRWWCSDSSELTVCICSKTVFDTQWTRSYKTSTDWIQLRLRRFVISGLVVPYGSVWRCVFVCKRQEDIKRAEFLASRLLHEQGPHQLHTVSLFFVCNEIFSEVSMKIKRFRWLFWSSCHKGAFSLVG